MPSRQIGRLILSLAVNQNYVQIRLPGEPRSKVGLSISSPPAHVAVLMVVFPRFWIPEAYCRGHWVALSGDLHEIISCALKNASPFYKAFLKLSAMLPSSRHFLKQKALTRYFSRKTKKHYDIEADIYRAFLDSEIVYTCAFFDGSESLEKAQERKFSLVLERLGLEDTANSILNIGAGWASLERYIVRNRPNVIVTGLSISNEQIEWADEHNSIVLDADQNRRISLIFEDYIHHQPSHLYDGVTVIGMIEHVGLSGYPEFFSKCAEMMRSNARLVVHTIVDGREGQKTAAWLDSRIFPGGYIPSVSEISRGAQNAPFVLENIYFHGSENYFRTLSEWEQRLQHNKDNILKIYETRFGYSESFSNYLFRQWEVYLASSKLAFHGGLGTSQVGHFVFRRL